MFDQSDFDWEAHFQEDVDELYALTVAEHVGPSDEHRQLLPSGLDSMLPDVFLAAILSIVDLSKLSGSDVVNVLKAQDRLASHHRAAVLEAMAETAHCVDPDTTDRSATVNEFGSEEIANALSLTRRKADHDLGIALDLRERLPQVMTALSAGLIDDRRAQTFSDGTAILDSDTARSLVGNLLEDAPQLTTGQLRARLRKLSIEADPDGAGKRYENSLSERKVVAEPNDEGTAALVISQCSPDDVYAARDRINRIARRLKTPDEARNIDQLRADVALGLLTGSLEARVPGRGSVDIHVDLTTLARLDESSAELAGYGPVVAEIARKVAAEQTRNWSATVTDPETGEPLHTVSLRRRPTAAQKRRVRARYPVCVFKGCRMPAVDSDIDHTTDYAKGGPTTVANQAPLCRRHHLAKHRCGWTYRRIGRKLIEWTSPLGQVYRVQMPP